MVILPTEKRFDWQRTPFSLFFLVLLNVLVFVLYQSGDGVKVQQAFANYEQNRLLELEWPVYQEYLKSTGREAEIAEFQKLINEGMGASVTYSLLFDFEFRPYLDANAHNHITNLYYEDWTFFRHIVNQHLDGLSFRAGGLIPKELSAFSLFSHQFLHGDVMHLLGNMFFLVVCGFAVEAAIGHLRFLSFYLVAGLAGGLMHAFFDMQSARPLVGASGAVSGVMAMYLGVFRLRKIEFFYWFFIFVGYFRAPALLLLPVYVGKELFDYFGNTDSNVAFMAHVGGFVAGAIMMAVTFLVKPNLVDQEYVEEDQQRDPFQDKLAKVYGYIESFQFQPALKSVQKMIEEYGLRFELALLRCNILRIEHGEPFQQALAEVLGLRTASPRQLLQQAQLWKSNPELQPSLDDELVVGLGIRLSGPEQFPTAEDIWKSLQQRDSRHPQLGVLAHKLAQAAAALDQPAKQERYQQLAQHHMPPI